MKKIKATSEEQKEITETCDESNWDMSNWFESNGDESNGDESNGDITYTEDLQDIIKKSNGDLSRWDASTQ